MTGRRPDPVGDTAVVRRPGPSRRESAYRAIREQILGAEFEPGTPLSEYQFATALGMSRTPIREALKQLEQEGLVKVIPQRGVFVPELSVQDIQEIYQIREQLECYAARVAATTMASEEAQELGVELARAQLAAADGQHRGVFESDIHLHKQIIRSVRNRRMETILSSLDDQVRMIRSLASRVPGRLQTSLREHGAIVDAILRRDPDGAEDAMRHHLVSAREVGVRVAVPLTRSAEDNGRS